MSTGSSMTVVCPQGVDSFVPELDKFKFQTIHDAVKVIDKGYYLAKVDLHHAYRSVPISPKNYPATGLKWRFKGHKHHMFIIDKCLPFGGRRSPSIFHWLTQSVKRMMIRRGFTGIIVYLDDFLIVAETFLECWAVYETLLELLTNLGFQISPGKLVPPWQQLVFLGIRINTVDLELSLPPDKLQETREVSKAQLQQLAGKLN